LTGKPVHCFKRAAKKLAIDGTLFDKSFARIVWMPVAEIFSSYFFSISLAKHLASTTNQTLDGDLGSHRFV
jgi:hypothetical protein